MICSFSTDYLADFHYHNKPDDLLRPLAAAGIRDIFWTQEAEGDFIYLAPEIKEITEIVGDFGMKLHGVAAPRIPGAMRDAWHCDNVIRQAGIRVIENRMKLARCANARYVWVSAPTPANTNRAAVKRSMEALLKSAKKMDVVLVMESCSSELLMELLENFPVPELGWSLQTALWNIGLKNSELLKRFGSRLKLIRAGDTLGYGLLRRLPFSGGIAWQELLGDLKRTAPEAELTLDVDVYSHLDCAQMVFLEKAKNAGEKLMKLWQNPASGK